MSTAADIEFIGTTRDLDREDFPSDPQCEVTTRMSKDVTETCTNPADWLGIPPCGCEGYFCDSHRQCTTFFRCLKCGSRRMHLTRYRWVKI